MKDGYYWVKVKSWLPFEVVLCNDNVFYLHGVQSCITDKAYFDEIGDYIETPEKYRG